MQSGYESQIRSKKCIKYNFHLSRSFFFVFLFAMISVVSRSIDDQGTMHIIFFSHKSYGSVQIN